MIKLTWRTLVAGGVRTWATLIALLVGSFLLAFALIVSATASAALNAGLAAGYRGADITVATSSDDEANPATAGEAASATEIGDDEAKQIGEIEGVRASAGFARSTAIVRAGEQIRGITIDDLPSEKRFVWQSLVSGSWPATNSEIALSTQTLDDLGLSVGDRIVFGKKSIGPGTFTVTGEIDTRGALDYESGSYGVVNAEIARTLANVDGVTDLRLALDPGVEASDVIAEINAIAPNVWPLTVEEAVTGTGGVFSMGIDLLRNVVVGLIAVSLVVTALVLGTIYTVSLSSRSRLLALERCVGATKWQVFFSVVAEAVLLAFGAGVVGAALAAAVSWVLTPLAGSLLSSVTRDTLTITVPALILPVVVIVIVAALASLLPALSASRVPPTVALGAAVEKPTRAVWSVLRFVFAVVALSGGVVALSIGSSGLSPWLLAIGIVSCGVGLFLLSFAAYAAAAAVLTWVGRAFRRATLSLTGANISRNPRRSAAIGVSVTVSAVLATTAWIALDSASQTLLARISETPAIDLTVGDVYNDAGLEQESLDAIDELTGVERVLGVDVAHDLAMTGTAPDRSTEGGTVEGVEVGGSDTAKWNVAVARLDLDDIRDNMRVPYALDEVDDTTVYLQQSANVPFDPDEPVTITGPLGEQTVHVEYVDHLDVPAFVSPELFDRLTDERTPRTTWISVDRTVDQGVLLDRIKAEAVLAGDQPVSGGLPSSIRLDAAIDIVKYSALALIAVAMVVALIGLGATTALSVAERRRENAVLRAIGLEREQLRHVVLTEGVLLALTGAVLGAALGIVYGLVAALGLGRALALEPVVVVPVLGVIGVIVVPAIVLWFTADSVAERASRIPPAIALADR